MTGAELADLTRGLLASLEIGDMSDVRSTELNIDDEEYALLVRFVGGEGVVDQVGSRLHAVPDLSDSERERKLALLAEINGETDGFEPDTEAPQAIRSSEFSGISLT